jgi:hypothetical protein
MPYGLKLAKPLFIYTIGFLTIAIRIHDRNPLTSVFAGPLASLEICLTQKKQKNGLIKRIWWHLAASVRYNIKRPIQKEAQIAACP